MWCLWKRRTGLNFYCAVFVIKNGVFVIGYVLFSFLLIEYIPVDRQKPTQNEATNSSLSSNSTLTKWSKAQQELDFGNQEVVCTWAGVWKGGS